MATRLSVAPAEIGVRPPAPSRMVLEAIISGVVRSPDRTTIIGIEGVGKSTYGANAPSPIFLASEEGVSKIGAARFPEPREWREVLDAVAVLENTEHGYKTLVVDTLDWLEPLVYAHVCRANGWQNIEEPGYGKGYVSATDEWRRFLQALDRLRNKKGMEIILLAHASIKNFANPSGPDFARYEAALFKTTAALVKQWSDTVLFATFEEEVVEAQSGKEVAGVTSKKKVKGVSTGLRVAHTERCAAWDAKNRTNLPPTIPLSYQDLAAYQDAFYAGRVTVNVDEVFAEVVSLAKGLGGDIEPKAIADAEKHRNNGAVLMQRLNRLKALVAEAKKEN